MKHVTTRGPDRVRIALVGLSKREIETLRLVCRGMRNKEIAAAMGTSENTVKTRLREISGNVGVNSKAELIAFALQRPAILEGAFVELTPHPPGCACASPYCSAMRPSTD